VTSRASCSSQPSASPYDSFGVSEIGSTSSRTRPRPCSLPRYVKRLEAAELVKREIDSADLGRHKLSLTPEGRKVMTGGLALLAEAFGQRLARLIATQQAELKSLLEKLR